ncbi:rho guanine nucleotide exchange factor 2 isoform X2 [Belonocnema kinseyi]|uniref:rho guanine nucleotide exchange factor 2 isoform X2 n=1 Tax=Belonocnema kinseyi TaxID=2817044 RepID=UPI00143D9451|nr:rho guanine nucleotide exchange factor 2 isoform X2 [Belonocnema kinseyi]
MEKHQERVAPFSSDECPNSGEDSEEDEVIDYSHNSVVNGVLANLNLHGTIVADTHYSKDNTVISMSEETNKQHSLMSGSNIHNQPTPLVPIINVTPQSPGLVKHYPLLDENLQHLHDIYDNVQRIRMQDPTLNSFGYSNRMHHHEEIHTQRLSCSCPSLQHWISPEVVARLHDQDGGSEPDLLTNCSNNSSPTHFSGYVHNHAQILQCIDRRRSWTDLENTKQNYRRCSAQNFFQAQNMRQRSVSLSSLDGEVDLELDGKHRKVSTNVSKWTCRSQASTHSLNEADFVQSAFKKGTLKRGNQGLGEAATLLPGVVGTRVTLQKSVSTPSIVTPPGPTHLADSGTLTTPLSTTGTVYDDQHSEKARRKRGSLFFRKKKDKSGKKMTSQHNHQWVILMAGSQSNSVCDFCMKNFAHKSILHCENCGAMIHQNQTCKDQLQLDCVKSKQHSGKAVSKSLSSVSMMTNSSVIKRGSTSSLPLPSVTGTGSGNEEFDFGEDARQFTVDNLEDLDPELGLAGEEPDSWSAAIGRNIALRLVGNCEREVKRQEHIYEFVLTEKHHCLVLLAMDKIFVEGLRHHFQMTTTVIDRMFPRLRDLIEIHLRFLLKLRRRQNTNAVVPTIADILIDQFSSENAFRMKSTYGDFCSRHRDAVEAYKYYLREDTRFARFVRHCEANPLLKKKGIPECILFVTQRLTKYPLLVEPLIKTGVAPEEADSLRKALSLVKVILADVDSCVADKEREDRKLEIYNRIDAKSYAIYRDLKFKKSDILASNRSLQFEGTAYLMQGRGKMAPVVVVVLSDVLFFLAETRDQKYAFFVPDNKAGVVSLQRLLVREKAGQESRGIYLISSNPSEPEMFELKVQKPKDKHLWIQSIRSAVELCPQDQDNRTDTSADNFNGRNMTIVRSSSISMLPSEEKLVAQAKESDIKNIIDELRKKDTEQALLLKEKMELQMKLLHTTNVYSGNEIEGDKIERGDNEVPDYTRLVRNEGIDSIQLWQEVVTAVQEATRLASSLSFTAGGGTLSRSLSSAGERHSEAYVPPSLCVPRRAETFAGFDYNKERHPWRDSVTLQSVIIQPKVTDSLTRKSELKEDEEVELNKDQHEVAIQLSHYVYTLQCIISNQMTTIEILHAQLAASRGGSASKSSNSRPNPNKQLEELRNLQDQLSREKASFRASTQQERSRLDEERAELNRLREQLTADQRDVTQQRDQLYRRLEALERQGVSLVAPSTAGAASIHLSHLMQGADQTQGRKSSQTDAKRIPLNLISATNQQKVQSSLPPVKQQLPLKLASGSNNNNNTRSGSAPNNDSPDRHCRTGSSLPMVTTSAFHPSEFGKSHLSSNLNQFHLSNRLLRSTQSLSDSYQQIHQPQQQQQSRQRAEQPQEEQVYFL